MWQFRQSLVGLTGQTFPGGAGGLQPAGLRPAAWRVAGKAFRLVERGGMFGLAVRVVAGQQLRRAAALGVASAECQGHAGRADIARVLRRLLISVGCTDDMALGDTGDARRRRRAGRR